MPKKFNEAELLVEYQLYFDLILNQNDIRRLDRSRCHANQELATSFLRFKGILNPDSHGNIKIIRILVSSLG
jgi:hypothetical protein